MTKQILEDLHQRAVALHRVARAHQEAAIKVQRAVRRSGLLDQGFCLV